MATNKRSKEEPTKLSLTTRLLSFNVVKYLDQNILVSYVNACHWTLTLLDEILVAR